MQYIEENKLHKSYSKPYFSFAVINAQELVRIKTFHKLILTLPLSFNFFIFLFLS